MMGMEYGFENESYQFDIGTMKREIEFISKS
jgi:hypothetical protein